MIKSSTRNNLNLKNKDMPVIQVTENIGPEHTLTLQISLAKRAILDLSEDHPARPILERFTRREIPRTMDVSFALLGCLIQKIISYNPDMETETLSPAQLRALAQQLLTRLTAGGSVEEQIEAEVQKRIAEAMPGILSRVRDEIQVDFLKEQEGKMAAMSRIERLRAVLKS